MALDNFNGYSLAWDVRQLPNKSLPLRCAVTGNLWKHWARLSGKVFILATINLVGLEAFPPVVIAVDAENSGHWQQLETHHLLQVSDRWSTYTGVPGGGVWMLHPHMEA